MCVWQRVRTVLETYFSVISFMKVFLLDLTAPHIGMALAHVAGAAEEGSFPRLSLAVGALTSAPTTQTYFPAPGTLLRPYLHPSDIYVALLCFWKTRFLFHTQIISLGYRSHKSTQGMAGLDHILVQHCFHWT